MCSGGGIIKIHEDLCLGSILLCYWQAPDLWLFFCAAYQCKPYLMVVYLMGPKAKRWQFKRLHCFNLLYVTFTQTPWKDCMCVHSCACALLLFVLGPGIDQRAGAVSTALSEFQKFPQAPQNWQPWCNVRNDVERVSAWNKMLLLICDNIAKSPLKYCSMPDCTLDFRRA